MTPDKVDMKTLTAMIVLVVLFGCKTPAQKVGDFPEFSVSTKDTAIEVLGHPAVVQSYWKRELGFHRERGVMRRWEVWTYPNGAVLVFKGFYLRTWDMADGEGTQGAPFHEGRDSRWP